jgi:protein-tyrosine phosphatase
MKLSRSVLLLAFIFLGVVGPAVARAAESGSAGECRQFVPGDNHIALTGQPNMRDLGGFVGTGGKRVLFHKLFRSGDLSKLTAADKVVLSGLGIQQLIDLRTDSERASSPDFIPAGASVFDLPLIQDLGGAGNSAAFFAQILSGKIKAEDYMMSLYSSINDFEVAEWTQIFNLLENGETTLYHCTAGKDRAGMTTALLLSALGVDRETIVADFMASNDYLKQSIEAQVGYLNALYGAGVGDLLRPVLGVEEKYIQAFFAAVDQQYGSVDQFLDVLGVNRGQLQRHFLESRGQQAGKCQ